MSARDWMAAERARHVESYGIDVICPTCRAGRGKFCLKAGITVHRSAADIAVHPRRIARSRGIGVHYHMDHLDVAVLGDDCEECRP